MEGLGGAGVVGGAWRLGSAERLLGVVLGRLHNQELGGILRCRVWTE